MTLSCRVVRTLAPATPAIDSRADLQIDTRSPAYRQLLIEGAVGPTVGNGETVVTTRSSSTHSPGRSALLLGRRRRDPVSLRTGRRLSRSAGAATAWDPDYVKYSRGHDWDEVLDYCLELADSIYSLFVLALLGALVGFGAAILLRFLPWVGIVAGGLLIPVATVILSRAVAREDNRNRG